MPVVVGVGPPGDSALASLIQAHRSRNPFAVIVDLDGCERPPCGADRVPAPAEFRRTLEAPLAVAQVASSPRMRNALVAMYSTNAPANLRVFADADSAITWVLRRLVAANVANPPAVEDLQSILRALRSAYVEPKDGDASTGSASAHMLNEVAGLIRLFREPAFLVRPDGSVIATNAAGQTQGRTSAWLAEVTATKTSNPNACAKLFRVRGHDAYIVVPIRPWEVPQALAGALNPWPPRLRETAELLAEGLTDKEIARRLNTSHATARTYVIRVFRRCGVHSRAELLSL